jgi:hypothetical protein
MYILIRFFFKYIIIWLCTFETEINDKKDSQTLLKTLGKTRKSVNVYTRKHHNILFCLI